MPRVLIVGASADRAKFGNKAVRAHVDADWEVVPVNPKLDAIEGLPTVGSVADAEGRFDRVVMYLPPAVGIGQLEAVAALDHGEFWVSPGAEDDALLARATELGLAPLVACSIVDVGGVPSLL